MEIFKNIPWYEWKYQVSNLGRVKSLKFFKEKLLKLNKDKYWYTQVSLYYKNKYLKIKTHRLVAQTFIDNILNKNQVNHINWNRIDNRVENLEWCTASENQLHSYRILWTMPYLRWKFWKLHHRSKKIGQYSLKWILIKKYESINEVKRTLWINSWNISYCCMWKLKHTAWYIWKYL